MKYEIVAVIMGNCRTFEIEAKSIADARTIARQECRQVTPNYSIQSVKPVSR